MTETLWFVARTDDNGNNFLVRGNIETQSIASALIDTLLARGHKQNYWALLYPKGQLAYALSANRILIFGNPT